MPGKNANSSIKCSVTSCSHHCHDKNYCSLNEIKVGCSDPSVTASCDTECASFDPSNRG